MRLKPPAAFLAVLFALLLPPLPQTPADDVVRIGSFEELCAFSEKVARGEMTNARACLTADIVATRPMRAIGTKAHMFCGKFDGQGHAVSRLVAAGPSGCQGLFGYVGPEGVVKDVTLQKAYIAGAACAGGIAGYSAGRIEGCRVISSRVICLGRDHYGTAAGGVAGLASGRVADCAVTLSSVRGPANTGGLCGSFHAGVMERNAFTGVVVCTGVIEAPAGLLAGSLHGGARMRFCAGCGAALTFLSSYAGGAAGGVFSESSIVGCVTGGPDNRGAARLAAALAHEEGPRDTNSQHFLP